MQQGKISYYERRTDQSGITFTVDQLSSTERVRAEKPCLCWYSHKWVQLLMEAFDRTCRLSWKYANESKRWSWWELIYASRSDPLGQMASVNHAIGILEESFDGSRKAMEISEITDMASQVALHRSFALRWIGMMNLQWDQIMWSKKLKETIKVWSTIRNLWNL